jgi:hypothetical protein
VNFIEGEFRAGNERRGGQVRGRGEGKGEGGRGGRGEGGGEYFLFLRERIKKLPIPRIRISFWEQEAKHFQYPTPDISAPKRL